MTVMRSTPARGTFHPGGRVAHRSDGVLVPPTRNVPTPRRLESAGRVGTDPALRRRSAPSRCAPTGDERHPPLPYPAAVLAPSPTIARADATGASRCTACPAPGTTTTRASRNRPRHPLRNRAELRVALPHHQRHRHRDLPQAVPQRPHDAGAHPAQHRRQPARGLAQALGVRRRRHLVALAGEQLPRRPTRPRTSRRRPRAPGPPGARPPSGARRARPGPRAPGWPRRARAGRPTTGASPPSPARAGRPSSSPPRPRSRPRSPRRGPRGWSRTSPGARRPRGRGRAGRAPPRATPGRARARPDPSSCRSA